MWTASLDTFSCPYCSPGDDFILHLIQDSLNCVPYFIKGKPGTLFPIAYLLIRRIDAFLLNWKPGMEPKPHYFWDSDVVKWIEAASYSLATHPDPELDALLDEVRVRIRALRNAGKSMINTH